MRFECIHCHKSLNLPDSKLPVGKSFSFVCPYCKIKNTAMIPASGNGPPAEHPEAAATVLPQNPPPPAGEEDRPYGRPGAAAPSPPAKPAPPTPLRPGEAADISLPAPEADLEEREDLDEAADGRPRALVVYDDPETAGFLVKKLDEIGYRGLVAMNLRDAARQIKFTQFRIMLIQEDYFGSSLSGNHLLRSVQVMDSRSRRGALTVLISPTLATLDDLTAFALSVDAIINGADLAQIGQILLSSLAQAKKLYAVYEEALAEHGLD